MKVTNKALNTAIVVCGVAVTAFFTQIGCNSATKDIAGDHSGHNHQDNVEDTNVHNQVAEGESVRSADADLEKQVDEALKNIAKGKENNDMALVMNEGIMKLLAVSREDTNNIRANYHLGLFSIESGQLEKAEKRFKKLVFLQPENQEFRKKLTEIQEELN